jgi:hypothetical protein
MSEPALDPDDFSAAFEAAFARLQVGILEACTRETRWPQKIAAGIRAGLEFAMADVAGARVLTSEALAHGQDGIERHERLLAYLGEHLLAGRREGPDGERLPEITERAMVGGVVALVEQRLDLGRGEELQALVPEAIQFVLTPYLGAAEARRVGGETSPPGPGKA